MVMFHSGETPKIAIFQTHTIKPNSFPIITLYLLHLIIIFLSGLQIVSNQ